MKEPQKNDGQLPSLEALGETIRTFHKKVTPAEKREPQNMGLAVQLGLELVAGVVVGAGIGLVLDRWLGTSPFLLVICFFLGAAGGALTLYRTVMVITKDETDESDKT